MSHNIITNQMLVEYINRVLILNDRNEPMNQHLKEIQEAVKIVKFEGICGIGDMLTLGDSLKQNSGHDIRYAIVKSTRFRLFNDYEKAYQYYNEIRYSEGNEIVGYLFDLKQ